MQYIFVCVKTFLNMLLTFLIDFLLQIRQYLVLQADKVAKDSCARVTANVLGFSTCE